jgi:hypothetical protein
MLKKWAARAGAKTARCMTPRTGRTSRPSGKRECASGMTGLCSPAKKLHRKFASGRGCLHHTLGPAPATARGFAFLRESRRRRVNLSNHSPRLPLSEQAVMDVIRGAHISADAAGADAPSLLTPVGRGASASRLLFAPKLGDTCEPTRLSGGDYAEQGSVGATDCST